MVDSSRGQGRIYFSAITLEESYENKYFWKILSLEIDSHARHDKHER